MSDTGRSGGTEPRYVILEADRSVADRDEIYLSLQRRVGPEYADAWLRGLFARLATLAEFPGPNAHPIARERERFDKEVRRLLYYGPTGRRSSRSQNVWRVLFMVIPSTSEEDETVIRVMRVLYGAQEMS